MIPNLELILEYQALILLRIFNPSFDQSDWTLEGSLEVWVEQE